MKWKLTVHLNLLTRLKMPSKGTNYLAMKLEKTIFKITNSVNICAPINSLITSKFMHNDIL
jgi:hypothetical protein